MSMIWMNIAICRLMGLVLGPQLPPLDVKSVIMITPCCKTLSMLLQRW